jgi:hypothetical protein
VGSNSGYWLKVFQKCNLDSQNPFLVYSNKKYCSKMFKNLDFDVQNYFLCGAILDIGHKCFKTET